MATLTELTLGDAVRLLNEGGTTAVGLLESLLSRIDRHDGAIGAYRFLDREDALQQAREADARRARGEAGALLGVPVSVKDLFNVKGQPCTCGSRMLENYRAPFDATVIARLRAAGAVIVGRLNMDEFAMGSSTENSAWGPSRNPWNTEYVPGGSSGGNAAAVAADLAFASLGTDTGGSIRQPASFCGCVGLKPTYGRVSRYGVVAYASSLDQVGPVTKDVRDAALLMNVIAGVDPRDSTSLDVPATDFTATLGRDLRGLRLGMPAEYFDVAMDPEVSRTVRAAIEVCRSLGAEIVPVRLPQTRFAIPTYYVIATAEASANLARFDGVRYGLRAKADDPLEMYERTRSQGFGAEVKRRIILGTYVLSSGYYDAYYLRAQKVRRWIRKGFDEVFHSCDALLTPTAPTTSFRFGEKSADPLQMYLSDIFTATVNLAGGCAISVPCGFSSAGMPVGMQVIGPALAEGTILQVAHAYEQATDWHTRRPQLKG